MTTKEYNEIYKKNFKEYFDKSLKEDGYMKKGTINFYRLNKLGLVEVLNFQRHYEELTVNFGISTIYCGVFKNNKAIGGRLGDLKYGSDEWWQVETEEDMKVNMPEILSVIRKELYQWFRKYEDKEEYIKKVEESYNDNLINLNLIEAATAAKFRRYDEILPHIEKLRKEYKIAEERNDIRLHYPKVLEEALLLEQKAKEGKESVDQYIVEREREFNRNRIRKTIKKEIKTPCIFEQLLSEYLRGLERRKDFNQYELSKREAG
ncbi:hypothetical protein JCM16774_1857 [Pseudoleptotrichia goodfellowii]|uniref:DUF4304 domain-containing protein n=2 Tax=Pseudoleptotrichia goodfellowii TaxID=157692 RepID=A0A510JET6_9FUSO|nr:hypothetical protein JCM16774_1857 [Pseudoleptotrichia goodfellowii]